MVNSVKSSTDNAKKGALKKCSKVYAPSKAMIRRQKIAQAVVQGKTEPQIAAELGMSRRGISKAKQHPQTQDFIRQFSAELATDIHRNNKRMVDTIYEGMNAKTVANRPDHKIRQTAVANQIKLLGAIQPKQEDAKANIAVTISELREALAG